MIEFFKIETSITINSYILTIISIIPSNGHINGIKDYTGWDLRTWPLGE